MPEEYQNLLILENNSEPEIPNYMKERNISSSIPTVLSTIIVVCAIISLIANIKRKSNIRIIFSIILPIVAILISQILKGAVLRNVIENGTEASSMGIIVPTIITLIGILVALVVMIIKGLHCQME